MEPHDAKIRSKKPKKRRPGIPGALTGAAGAYFAAAELSRRGAVALFTVRNTKGFDVVVTSQNGCQFSTVQVKTVKDKRPGFWLLGSRPDAHPPETAFYVFVWGAGDLSSPMAAYVVPATIVVATYDQNPEWPNWACPKGREPEFLNRWDSIMSSN